MAIPRPFRRDVHSELERLVRLHTSSEGFVDLSAVKTLLAAFLMSNPKLLDAERQANATVEDWDKRRRPVDDRAGGQLSLFDPDAFVPVDVNVRRRMTQCGPDDLRAWATISITEHASSAAAHARRMGYIDQRLRAWTPGHPTLGDLERDVFGFGP